jgi:hypothetical protein
MLTRIRDENGKRLGVWTRHQLLDEMHLIDAQMLKMKGDRREQKNIIQVNVFRGIGFSGSGRPTRA